MVQEEKEILAQEQQTQIEEYNTQLLKFDYDRCLTSEYAHPETQSYHPGQSPEEFCSAFIAGGPANPGFNMDNTTYVPVPQFNMNDTVFNPQFYASNNDGAEDSDNTELTGSTLAIPNITQRDQAPAPASSGSLSLND